MVWAGDRPGMGPVFSGNLLKDFTGIVLFFGGMALLGLALQAIVIGYNFARDSIIYVLFLETRGVPVYIAIGLAIACFIGTALIWHFRDLRNKKIVAIAHIFASIVSFFMLFAYSGITPVTIVSAIVAMFSGANGFKRLHEIYKLERAI